MPIYNYKCDDCNKTWEEFKTIEKRIDVKCECGKKAKIIISTISRPVIYEGYNEGLGAYITGPRQKREIMRQKNLEEA